ncbi:hypothetical protein [Gorillibacterium timonense]|uniref:hypothetical protein n=1 Tax=Gorillibacterium timonense TaxID=1689269 RepID=UPI00071CF167|nr:hypothetical protein [Gorillibacterium timonense]
MPETDQAVLMEILQRITKIETKIESLTNLDRVAADAYKIANEALQSTKSAHNRLDALYTSHEAAEEVARKAREVAEDSNRKATEALTQLKAEADDQKWFKRTFYGATITAIVGSLITIIWAALKLGGHS